MLVKELEAKIEDQIVQINMLATDNVSIREVDNLKHDQVLSLEQKIDERDQMIEEYRQQIWEIKEDLMNKE